MRIHNYPIYHQGACFYDDDFDVFKLIQYLYPVEYSNLSARTLSQIRESTFHKGAFDDICHQLGFDWHRESESLVDYTVLLPDLLHEIDELFYVKEGETNPFTTESVYGVIYHDIEGEFILDGAEEGTPLGESTMLLSFHLPYVWDQGKSTLPLSRSDAETMLRIAAKKLLKDDIDWSKRLGAFLGVGCDS